LSAGVHRLRVQRVRVGADLRQRGRRPVECHRWRFARPDEADVLDRWRQRSKRLCGRRGQRTDNGQRPRLGLQVQSAQLGRIRDRRQIFQSIVRAFWTVSVWFGMPYT